MTALPISPFLFSPASEQFGESPRPSSAPDKPHTDAGINSVSLSPNNSETAAVPLQFHQQQAAAADNMPDIPEFLRRKS